MSQRMIESGANPFIGMALMGQLAPPQQAIIGNFLSLGTTLPQQLESIRTAFQRFGPNPTPAQIEATLTQLHNALRVGGTLGLTYLPDAGREPRAPSALVQNRSGDCDELAMTFIAAATRLGIPLTGVRFAGIDFNTSRPGAAATVPHAVLFVTVNGHNYIFDMTRQAPTPVRDFSDATVAGEYRGRSITYGPNSSSPNLTGIGRMTILPTVADAVAAQMLTRADYFDTRAQRASGAAQASALGQAAALLASVSALGLATPFITVRLGRVALNVFDRTEALAASEHDAKRYAGAVTQYRAALSMLHAIPSLRAARGQREFDIQRSLADACRALGRYDDALAAYDAMMRLKPADRVAYVSAYELNISRYKRARTRTERRTHLTRAYVISRIAGASRSLDAKARTALASQTAALERGLRALGLDPAGISIPPSP